MEEQINEYRKNEKIKRYFYEKYRKLIEIDPIKLKIKRIQSFARRYILYDVINIDKEGIDNIPGIYRYRIKINKDYYINKIIEQMRGDNYDEIMNIIEKINENISIMIDIRVNGEYQNMMILIKDQIIELPEEDKIKIIELYKKINETSIYGIRFKQMINASKILCNTYNI